MNATVVVLQTAPGRVLNDYRRLMHLAAYEGVIDRAQDTLLKLNLSWTKYFPACSSQPWQLEGVIRTLLEDGFVPEKLFAVENKTLVTNPWKGARRNLWLPILERYGLTFTPLTEVEWERYVFQKPLLKLHEIFPDGIWIPKLYPGKQIVHLPTMKTHGHAIITGAIKNSFGGLLKEVRHYAHKYMHEVLVDLMIMQQELHPGMFAVMDGTVCGDGAGPRTMVPRVKNYILASADQVAIDAVAASMMGFAPLSIPYLRMCHERQLGVADLDHITLVGEDISQVNFGFSVRRSPGHLGRPNDSQRAAAPSGKGPAALTAGVLGAAGVAHLSRSAVVSADRSSAPARLSANRLGSALATVSVDAGRCRTQRQNVA